MPDLRIDPARLRAERLRRAYSQSELARRAGGLDASTISRLEGGDRCARITTIRKLADALGVDPLEIASLDGDEVPA